MSLPLKHYKDLLMQYLKPQWRRALLMVILLLASVGLQLVNPLVLRYFIDTVIAGGSALSMTIAGVIFIGIALTNQAVSVFATYISQNVAWTATNSLRVDLVAHCLALDMAFYWPSSFCCVCVLSPSHSGRRTARWTLTFTAS